MKQQKKELLAGTLVEPKGDNPNTSNSMRKELAAGQHGDVTMTSPRNSDNFISVAKLLKNVGTQMLRIIFLFPKSKKTSCLCLLYFFSLVKNGCVKKKFAVSLFTQSFVMPPRMIKKE